MTPPIAPGNVREYSNMASISKKSTGTDQLLNFSMPLLTPAVRMMAVVPRNIVWNRIGA